MLVYKNYDMPGIDNEYSYEKNQKISFKEPMCDRDVEITEILFHDSDWPAASK